MPKPRSKEIKKLRRNLLSAYHTSMDLYEDGGAWAKFWYRVAIVLEDVLNDIDIEFGVD